MRNVRAHLESDVTRLHAAARDWSELWVTRLLAEPLYFETPDRHVGSHIVESLERIDTDLWDLRLCQVRAAPSATQVCEQLVAARSERAGGALAAAMFRGATPLGADRVRLRTRMPIARAAAILANPAVAPLDPAAPSGAFTLTDAGDPLVLTHREAGGRLTLFAPGAQPSDDWDISGPMGPRFELGCDGESPETWLVPLDMAYVLILPRAMPVGVRSWIRQRLDRQALCAGHGRVRPAHRLTALWSGAACIGGDDFGALPAQRTTPGTTPIYFTEFEGNAELATAIAHSLSDEGCAFEAQACDYSLFLQPARPPLSEGIRLAIVASPWPDPAAMLAASYFAAETPPAGIDLFRAAMAAETPDLAEMLARQAEDLLVAAGSRLVVVGQVIGRMWSKIGPFWSPPSAWTDLSSLPAWRHAACE